jgi:hypothetical protein
MSSDEDTFFEDDEYEEEEDSFPDEEIEEEEEEEYEDEYEDEDEDYDLGDEVFDDRTFKERVAEFIKDPWPKTVFFVMIVGFAVVLLTPAGTWALYRYAIVGVYILIILAGVGAVYSMITWIKAGADKLRYAGITNLAVVVLATILGILDTTFWIVFGTSVIPGYEVSLLFICYVLVIFSLYSLWMIQKSLEPQVKR